MGNCITRSAVNPSIVSPVLYPVFEYERDINIPFVQEIDKDLMKAAEKMERFRHKRNIYGLSNEDIQEIKQLKLTIQSKMQEKKSYGW